MGDACEGNSGIAPVKPSISLLMKGLGVRNYPRVEGYDGRRNAQPTMTKHVISRINKSDEEGIPDAYIA